MLPEMFQKIGFNAKEATLYTILYQRGPNPVSTLAKLSGIKRTTVYDILKNLIERGLILNFQQGGTSYFAIDDVQKLYFEQKEKALYAEKIVQELKSNPLNTESLQINYYKGQEGYRQMYEDILRHKPPEFVGWMNIDNFYSGIDLKREEEWTKERHQKGIKVRLIMQESPLSHSLKKEDAKINREIKIIPAKKFPFESSAFIYENHITFFNTTNEVFTGIRIQHPEFYRMQKEVFEMTWKLF